MDLKVLTELLHAIVWPVVVVVAAILYKKPLSTFLAGLGQRVTKLSAFDVSVELAALPEPPSRWSDPDVMENSEMRGGGKSAALL